VFRLFIISDRQDVCLRLVSCLDLARARTLVAIHVNPKPYTQIHNFPVTMSPTCGGTFQQSIDCSAQPLDLSFHPNREYVMAAALADGTIESESNSDRDALLQMCAVLVVQVNLNRANAQRIIIYC
jgi:hypothetical protein